MVAFYLKHGWERISPNLSYEIYNPTETAIEEIMEKFINYLNS
jgi:hypothetical protein